MSDPFVAEIRIFAGNFAPRGWALCNGQLLPISQNTALFSLLGTTYGGDGKSTFALPNLQGSAPIAPGQGPGLSLRDLGESGGEETVTLLNSEMPAHTHALQASSIGADDNDPSPNNVLTVALGGAMYNSVTTPTVQMNLNALPPAGGSLPHNNMQPYLALTFIIALQGIFPARSGSARCRPSSRCDQPVPRTAPSSSACTRARAPRSWPPCPGRRRRKPRSCRCSSTPRTCTTASTSARRAST
jgi:microcystin-dependent protein